MFPNVGTRVCTCPLLYAYKHGRLDGQSIPCLRSASTGVAAEQMNRCDFRRLEKDCQSTLQTLTDANATYEHSLKLFYSSEVDNGLIRQLYDSNYLSCTSNYTFVTSAWIARSRLLNNFGLVIGVILGLFVVLLILVMALLNGLQYKMREYDEAWTWRGNMSWSTLRRTLSQTSLRRSRRDLRASNAGGHGLISKSDNQLDRLRSDAHEHDDRECEFDFRKSQSIQDDLKAFHRM